MKQTKKYRRILAATVMLPLLAACGEETQSASSLPDLGPWVITRESPAPSEKTDSTARPVVVTETPTETPAPAETMQQNTGAGTTMQPEQDAKAETTTQPEQDAGTETTTQPEQTQAPEQTPVVSQFAEIEEPQLEERTDIDRSWLEEKIYSIEDNTG